MHLLQVIVYKTVEFLSIDHYQQNERILGLVVSYDIIGI